MVRCKRISDIKVTEKSTSQKLRSTDLGMVLVVDGVHAEVTQGPEIQHQNKENSRKLREWKTQF